MTRSSWLSSSDANQWSAVRLRARWNGPRQRGPCNVHRDSYGIGMFGTVGTLMPPCPWSRPWWAGARNGNRSRIVLVVDFDALGQARSRVARDDQADQHAVHVHLIAVRRGAAAQAAAVREARIDRRVERDDVAGEAVGDRDRPAQVDGVDDVRRADP